MNRAARDTDESEYSAERIADISQFLWHATEMGPAAAVTPFQTTNWLGPWFRILAPAKSIEPVLVTVRDKSTGEIAMLLPLVRRRTYGIDLLEFPDLSVSDYAFPLLGPAAPESSEAALAAWKAACGCMPKVDLIRLHKLPPAANGKPNPLAFLPVKTADTVRNIMHLPESWDEYLRSRPASFRKECRRRTRIFQEMGGGEYQMLTDVAKAHEALSDLEKFHRKRIEALGGKYILHEQPFSRFYHELVEQGLGSFLLLSIMMAGDGSIAVAYSLLHGLTCTTVRLAYSEGEWDRCAPGLLLATEIVRWSIENGLKTFDFGVGEYEYKKRIGCEVVPLLSYEKPMNIRGCLALIARNIRKSQLARRQHNVERTA
jgi:CelD/BcsL family acetyltransferase involved in cellulose biosynthesis